MTYSVGDRLTGKPVAGGPREYRVTKVNRATVEFKLVKIGDMPVSGEVHRERLNEDGTLAITRGKKCVLPLQKKTA